MKEALSTDLGVSGVCRKYGISNALYYKWQERFFEGALEGMKRVRHGPSSAEPRRLDEQNRKIELMQNVIAEIRAENIEFKKILGNCKRSACGY